MPVAMDTLTQLIKMNKVTTPRVAASRRIANVHSTH